MHVVGVTWKPTRDGQFRFGLTVWNNKSERPDFAEIPLGKRVSWTVLGPKQCIGFNNDRGRLERCPERSTVSKSVTRCGPCSAMDMYDICVWCNGSTCNAGEERRGSCLSTDYVIYLAVFGENSLKVGVSSKRRVMTRWVEQGADYAAIIAETKGGLAARRLESSLGRSSNVTKSMRASSKALQLLTRASVDEAQEKVSSFVSSTRLLDESGMGPVHDLSGHYGLDTLDSEPQQWYRRSDPIDGRKILGDVVGMKGSLLVTKIDSVFTVHNLKQLLGFTIDSTQPVEVVTQSGLEDFF